MGVFQANLFANLSWREEVPRQLGQTHRPSHCCLLTGMCSLHRIKKNNSPFQESKELSRNFPLIVRETGCLEATLKQQWSNSEATAWKSCQNLGWKKQDQDSWGISKCMFMGFSFLFCDWGNRITPDGKFVFRIILGGILRWLKQICLVGVKLWFLFKHALALHSPASLAKIWLDEGLARTSFGPDHRALPISVPSVGQVYHPRCSLPCRWCCVISALLWLAPLQATYLFCCSVQGRSCFPSEGGHWILTRAKKIGNKCEISKRKCLCHWYSKKKRIWERQLWMETRGKRLRLKQRGTE